NRGPAMRPSRHERIVQRQRQNPMKLRRIVSIPILLGISVSLLLAIGRSGGAPLDYTRELVSPGFLFVLAMCVWLWRNPKTLLPLQAIVFFLLLPVLGGFCGTALHFADLAFPLKWDHVLYRLDAGLGFAPAWVVGQWARASRGFWQQVYEIWA